MSRSEIDNSMRELRMQSLLTLLCSAPYTAKEVAGVFNVCIASANAMLKEASKTRGYVSWKKRRERKSVGTGPLPFEYSVRVAKGIRKVFAKERAA